jgi:hypothetical protein
MSGKIKTITVNQEDIAFIFSDGPGEFEFITSRCFCMQCQNGYNSSIVNYTIKLNSLYDIELDGFCKDCNHKVGRYIETGETEPTAKNAEAIWKTHTALKELKIKKPKNEK